MSNAHATVALHVCVCMLAHELDQMRPKSACTHGCNWALSCAALSSNSWRQMAHLKDGINLAALVADAFDAFAQVGEAPCTGAAWIVQLYHHLPVLCLTIHCKTKHAALAFSCLCGRRRGALAARAAYHNCGSKLSAIHMRCRLRIRPS